MLKSHEFKIVPQPLISPWTKHCGVFTADTRFLLEIDGRWVLSQTEMEPDDNTVIFGCVFWRVAVLIKL